jgi:hydroxymethylpyrimidine/phosphomethylpyrimidine kinase
MMKTALTVAGSDPTGGAGIQSDLKTFRAFGLRGLSAIAALTAQDSINVISTVNVAPAFLAAQIETLLNEFRIDALKIGMLGSAGNVRVVEGIIRRERLRNIVLDPVMRSSGGQSLLGRGGAGALKGLMAVSTIVTPNLDEASALSGVEVRSGAGMERAALLIHALGAPCVLVKGGHLRGGPVDLLYDGKTFSRFHGRRIRGTTTRLHGTGCALSSAIAARLALGATVRDAVADAKRYVEDSLSAVP